MVPVDYPLAPEHRFPAAVDAGYPATTWVADHADDLGIDPTRLAVAGDSAGGNLAAVVTLKARSAGTPHIAFQLLIIYPDLNFRRTNRSITELVGRYGNVTREAREWFMNHYLADPADRLNPPVSPLPDPDLAGLPPAHIVTRSTTPSATKASGTAPAWPRPAPGLDAGPLPMRALGSCSVPLRGAVLLEGVGDLYPRSTVARGRAAVGGFA